VILRNLDLERDITEYACRGAVDPAPLIQHSEVRAARLSGEYVQNPQHILPGRNRRRDVREELADVRNHLVFLLQEEPEAEDRQDLLIVLRLAAIAYDRITPR
jgi:hypothetical protein